MTEAKPKRAKPQTLVEACNQLNIAMRTLFWEIAKAMRLEKIVQFCQRWSKR